MGQRMLPVVLPLPYIAGAVPAKFQTSNPNHPLLLWARENGVVSLTDLASRLDVSKPRLSQILARKNRPSTDLALRMARVASIRLEDLVELTPTEIRAGVRAGWERKPSKRRKPRRA